MVANDKRTLTELKIMAQPALDSPELVKIARDSRSPSCAYRLALKATGNKAKAKLCRWLSMIKREYGEEFERFVREEKVK